MTGFIACHSDQVRRLSSLGLESSAIVQGYGWAEASAGTHTPVGNAAGHPFAHCIDVSPIALSFTRAHFDALVRLGFAPFPRDHWSSGTHWHLVDSTRAQDDNGSRPDHLDSVNHQLAEWVTGGDGLVGDAPMPAEWRPTQDQREFIRRVWIAGTLEVGPQVIGLDGKPLSCHAAVIGNETWVDLGALLPALAGKALDLRRDTAEGPSRGKLREIAEAFGFTLDTSQWPTVRITRL